jgi:integrase
MEGGARPTAGGFSSLAALSYLKDAIAPSTRKTYQIGIAAFRQWRSARGTPPDALPTTDEIGGWLADAADSGGLSASTLRVYASAVSTWYEETRHPDSREANPASDPLVSRLLKGIQRHEVTRAHLQGRNRSDAVKPADLLLPTLLKFRFGDSPRDGMMRAAACLAVGGGLRPSELLGSKDYPERALRREQIAFFAGAAGERLLGPPTVGEAPGGEEPTVLQLTLLVTKTSQMSGVVKLIAAPTVVDAVWRWFRRATARSPSDLLFQAEDGTPLTTHALVKDMERRHAAAGLGLVHYTGKSWRRGGAGTLAALGYDEVDIAALGWSVGSRQWETYSNDPQVRRQRAILRGAMMEPGRPREVVAAAPRR